MIRKLVIVWLMVLTALSINPSFAAEDSILTWDASTGDVTGYKIYYGTSAGNYSYSQDVGNTNQYALDTLTLTPGATYYFTVKAYNSFGESETSNVATYVVPLAGDTTPPLPPQGFSAETSGSDVNLGWLAGEPDILEYRVYYGTSSRNYGLPVSVNGTAYTVAGLVAETKYYFAVTAVDTAGNESGYSTPEISVVLPSVRPPSVSESVQVDVRISQSIDDIEERVGDGHVFDTSSDLELVDDMDNGGGQIVGLRFQGLIIPQGATIDNAYIEFEVDETSDNATSLTISVEASDNAAVFTNDARVLTNRRVSESSVPWKDVPSWSQTNEKHRTSDISPLIQEIVKRNGWQSGNAMVFIISGSGYRIAESYDGEPANAPLLHVSYSSGSTLPVDNTPSEEPLVEPEAPDTQLPVVTISTPTSEDNFQVSISTIDLEGTATDNDILSSVTWVNSAGGSGTASGTDSWSASGINLMEGSNVITVKAQDAAGNESSDTLTVTYTPPAPPAPAQWTVLTRDDFEPGWGSYVDGGGDCTRYSGKYAHQGTYAAQIRDNSGTASSFYSAQGVNLDGPAYTELKIEFWFYPRSMESGEDFFVEYYDGSKWNTVATYAAGSDFSNNSFYHEEGIVLKEGAPYPFPTAMKLRFRCDASGNYDFIYIDEVIVSAR
ncbi:fibronectin type III domain-containing protein [Desulfocicer niacini]